VTEFEIQRALDLPAPLPADERLVWMGAPTCGAIARNVFHLPALAAYFVAVLLAHAAWVAAGDAGIPQALLSAMRLLPLGLLALGLFLFLAWMIARTSAYALTDRRVIMRIGVALSITLNIPLRCIASADLRLYADGTGDLPLTLTGNDRMAYLNLWPHARPWQLKNTVPMLLGIPEAERVGALLADTIRQHLGQQQAGQQQAGAALRPGPGGRPASNDRQHEPLSAAA
jgi:hypothetical protein